MWVLLIGLSGAEENIFKLAEYKTLEECEKAVEIIASVNRKAIDINDLRVETRMAEGSCWKKTKKSS